MASPVANQLGSPKPKQSSAASTSDELVHQNVEAALRRLFSNSTYVPLDPFKSVLFSLRRKERSQGTDMTILSLSEIYGTVFTFTCLHYAAVFIDLRI